MSTSVKFFHAGMTGAPQVSNAWGDLTALLDACLVNGYSVRPVQGIRREGGTATVDCNAHGFAVHQVVCIEGAAAAAYNGEQRITAITANSFSFAVTGEPPTPDAGGAISAKVAPLGWETAFSGTHKRAYRSKHPQSPKNMLLIDNAVKPGYTTTWAKWANVGIVESMSDIDTITGAQAPFDPAFPGQNWGPVRANQWGWYKWMQARASSGSTDSTGDGGAGNRNWVLVGDARRFYLFLAPMISGSYSGRCFYAFGDIESAKPGDAFATLLAADDFLLSSDAYGFPGQRGDCGLASMLAWSGKLLLRSHTQMGLPVRCAAASLNTETSAPSISGRGSVPYPNGADYSLLLLPVYLLQEDRHLRGRVPGLLWVPHTRPVPDMTVVDNVVGQPGRRFLLLRMGYQPESEGAQVAFDISGPWG